MRAPKLADFPLRADLVRELESFSVTWSSSNNMRLDGGDGEGHADMAVASSLAWWLSDSTALGAVYGEHKLLGFY